MRTGSRDRLIRIEQPGAPVDTGYGTESGAWVTVIPQVFAQVADVLPSRGETPAGGIDIASRPSRVRIDYIEGVVLDSTMRIVLLDRGDRIMQIVTQPAEIGRKEGFEFMAQDFSTAGTT